MKIFIVLQVLLVLTVSSCGKEEIPSIQKPVIAVDDYDADGLSKEDETELGTNEHIADFPLLSLQIVDQIQVELQYNLNGVQKQLNFLRSPLAQTSDYIEKAYEFLTSPLEKITPIAAKLSFSIQESDLFNKLSSHEVQKLKLSIHTYVNGEKKLILENKTIDQLILKTPYKLENLEVDPAHLTLALYHGAGIYIEIQDYVYQHPISEKELSYESMLSVQNESCGVILLKDTHIQTKLCALKTTFSNLLDYFQINLSEEVQDFELEKQPQKEIVTKTRKNRDQAFRVVQPSKKLQRLNGKVQGISELTTQSNEILVRMQKENFIYSSNHKLYGLTQNPGGGIAPMCGCQVRSISGSQSEVVLLNHLSSIIDLNRIHKITQINSSTWLLQTNNSLPWFLKDNLEEFQIIGDYLKKCEHLSQYIFQYDKAQKHYSEKTFTLEIIEISNH